MKRILFLLLLCILLFNGCLKKETMYIKPFELAEEDLSRMLTRMGGIFEYNIDNNIKMITYNCIKYEKDTEPETFFKQQIVLNPEFSRKTSRFIFQISKYNGNISLLTESATSSKIYDKIKSYELGSIPLSKKVDIIPDVAIPLLIMPSLSVKNPYFDIESYMSNPEIIKQYAPILVFSITFHSQLPKEEK